MKCFQNAFSNICVFSFVLIYLFEYKNGFSQGALATDTTILKSSLNYNSIFEISSKSKEFLHPNFNVDQKESFQNLETSSIVYQAEIPEKKIMIFNGQECLLLTGHQGSKKDFLPVRITAAKWDFVAQVEVQYAEIQGQNGDIGTTVAQGPKGYAVPQGVTFTSPILHDKGLFDGYHFYIEYPNMEANENRPNSDENGLPGPTNAKLIGISYFTFIDGPPVIENYSPGCQNYAELDLKINSNSVSPSIFQRLLKAQINAEDVFVIWVGEEIDSSVRWIIKTELKGVVVSSVKTNLSSDDLPIYSVRLRYNSIRETQAVIDQKIENHITTSVFNWNYNTQTHSF